MISKLTKKKGFTLIELLVVIGIVAMLSMMAVNGYITYRKSALIDLNTDNLISQINEQRYRAIHKDDFAGKAEEIKAKLKGEVAAEVLPILPKCYGLYLLKDGDRYQAFSFDQDFNSKKEFDVQSASWKYAGCGNFDVNTVSGKAIELDDLINIYSISGDPDFVFFRFSPPDGAFFSNLSSEENVSIFVRYGDQENGDFSKQIDMDFLNVNFVKKDVQIAP